MTRIIVIIVALLSAVSSMTGDFTEAAQALVRIMQTPHAPIYEKTITPISSETFDIPLYHGVPYIEINSNIPFFHGEASLPEGYEEYSPLDQLGRCGVAEANLSISLMPEGKRESIGMIKPSGWHTVRYDDIIEKKYLYNRCHLIGFQLAGENANHLNLITGTRYLNMEGMLPFERHLINYIRKTKNHVRYRVTPIFVGNELVARGVLMEAESVEDNGKGLMFNVYCYNVQPGIEIDYLTGESHAVQ